MKYTAEDILIMGAKICKDQKENCDKCPLWFEKEKPDENGYQFGCLLGASDSEEKAKKTIEIIIKKTIEIIIKNTNFITREQDFLNRFPNAKGFKSICPQLLDQNYRINEYCYNKEGCYECRENWWNTKIEKK